jgi:hypothetical protein
MDIALVSYLYFELGLHVAPKNMKLDVRRKATKKQQFNGIICNKNMYNGASNKTSKKY